MTNWFVYQGLRWLRSCLTHACASAPVQGETLSTLTEEGALGVDTAPVGTHPREHLTLIDVWRGGGKSGVIKGLTVLYDSSVSVGGREWNTTEGHYDCENVCYQQNG